MSKLIMDVIYRNHYHKGANHSSRGGDTLAGKSFNLFKMTSSSSFPNLTKLIKYFAALLIFFVIYRMITAPTKFIDTCPLSKSSSFIRSMREIAWHKFKISIFRKDFLKVRFYSNNVFSKLFPFLLKPISLPVNQTCSSPDLKISQGYNCSRLKKPRKVGMLLQFGFEIDALEIHLNELDAVVDKFFIVESTISHSHVLGRKPLVWEAVKYDERFAKFLPKIVHFVLDDAVFRIKNNWSDKWRIERLQEKHRWTKFREWNLENGYFDSNDLLGFGDTDEIPNRDNVFTLKSCILHEEPVDIGIWFPFPFIDSVFRTDWPVANHSYSLGDPSFFTVGAAMKFGNGTYPNRMRGKSRAFLLGGIHMSQYAFPPYQIIKTLTATELQYKDLEELAKIGIQYSSNDTTGAAARLNISPKLMRRIKKISDLSVSERIEAESIAKVPWFVQCNPNRFPTLRENGSDGRLM